MLCLPFFYCKWTLNLVDDDDDDDRWKSITRKKRQQPQPLHATVQQTATPAC